MKVRFYGRLAEAIARELDLTSQSSTVADLRDRLAGEFPEAAGVLKSSRARAVVSNEIVPDTHRLAGVEEVEFLSPVSGG